MSYGGGNLGNHAWSLPEDERRPFIKKALEAGINFFDTADRYSLGNGEEILGRAIKDFAATKSSSPPRSTAGCVPASMAPGFRVKWRSHASPVSPGDPATSLGDAWGGLPPL
jgi:aryl-alcohol dehydrogenase-like predicted oxidoreductase